jgi:hypothetical protein
MEETMSGDPGFDAAMAHRFFSADCFNRTWGLLDKSARSPEEDQEMIQLAVASLWHWNQRPDRTGTNLSVGYWLASRVYSVLGRVDEARRYAALSLEAARGGEISPFYHGYAYEALARAESAAGDRRKMSEFLAEARRIAVDVADEEERKALLSDLENIA